MSAAPSIWETIAVEAGRESELWAAALRPAAEREQQAVFSPLAEGRYAVGLESIYEGYLLHYGRPRLFQADDRDTRILLGDYLYAHGLVRIAALGSVDAVGALAELLSLCAHLRAEGLPGDGDAWAATVCSLDGAALPDEAARALALRLHAERVE
ncbi:MAG TPA: hypothetical protein VFW80_00685 [Gaiellaceae bacterium]|nr:hypothetical protein [Gaiellaceae bacterium]